MIFVLGMLFFVRALDLALMVGVVLGLVGARWYWAVGLGIICTIISAIVMAHQTIGSGGWSFTLVIGLPLFMLWYWLGMVLHMFLISPLIGSVWDYVKERQATRRSPP